MATPFPLEWGSLLYAPIAAPKEAYRKFGQQSVKLTGQTKRTTAPRTLTAPSLAELKGKEVTFAAWVYSAAPEETSVAIIYGWSNYRAAKPTRKFQWQLLEVTATVPEDATFLHFAISLGARDKPVVCYVDGATLFTANEASPN